MSMMATKVSDLEGAELDYWVAKAEGACDHDASTPLVVDFPNGGRRICGPRGSRNDYSPSTDWSQGGPLIEREQIALWANDGTWVALHQASVGGAYYSNGTIDARSFDGYTGPTPLIAAMRCFVASKFAEVDSPLVRAFTEQPATDIVNTALKDISK